MHSILQPTQGSCIQSELCGLLFTVIHWLYSLYPDNQENDYDDDELRGSCFQGGLRSPLFTVRHGLYCPYPDSHAEDALRGSHF